MISDSLRSARLKIVWAQEHLKLVKRDIDSYIDANPHALKTYKNIDGRLTQSPAISIQPDDTLSLMIGDCLTNARAALDHVMFQLVVRYFDPPFDITKTADRNIAGFPLFNAPSTDPNTPYANRFTYLPRRMPMAADAVDVIKNVQPHNRTYEPLWWLHELVNTDKHRLLLVAESEINRSTFFIWHSYTGMGVTIPDSTGVTHADIRRLTGFGTETDTSAIPGHVQVNYEPKIEITFKDVTMPPKNTPVTVVLDQIIETVLRVIPQFERFF